MAKATTEKFEEMVLEVETSTPGQYARICGIVGVDVTRQASVDTEEVPDCDDESLPLAVERQVRSLDVSVSGTGVWARESSEMLQDWYYSSATKKIRIGNLNVASGSTEYEQGPALLTSLGQSRTKGKKVSASIEIQFDGTPTRVAKA